MCYTFKDSAQQTALCWFRYVQPGSGLPEQFRPRRSWGRRSWVWAVRRSEDAATCGDFSTADLYYALGRELFRASQEVCGTNPAFEGIWERAYKRVVSDFIE